MKMVLFSSDRGLFFRQYLLMTVIFQTVLVDDGTCIEYRDVTRGGTAVAVVIRLSAECYFLPFNLT